jgi:predicted permease
MDALAAWRPPIDVPILISAVPDARVFLYTLLASVATTLLFGLLPAMQSTRTDLVPALKNEVGSEKLGHWHLRDYVVAIQVALSVLLLVCSVLVVRSLQRALNAPIGYNPNGAVTASFDLDLQGYNEARGREFERRLLEKVRSIPGVESAALTDALPLTLGGSSSSSIFIEGQPKPKASEAPLAYEYSVSPDYFRTMQTKLLAGREFDLRDKQGGKPVAVVNQAFVRQLLRNADPLGKRFMRGPDGTPIEIVGVAQDGKYISLSETPKPAFWRPMEIAYRGDGTLVVRTQLSGSEGVRLIRDAVQALDPDMALYATGTLAEQLALTLLPARIAGAALAAFGLLAAILAATGIYGVMAYAVSRRTREIGIRVAIGASQVQVLGLVAWRALFLIGSGTVIGLGTALAVGRLLEQILYGVEPTDPVTFATVFILMVAIGTLACCIPVRRALRIDPMTALRHE